MSGRIRSLKPEWLEDELMVMASAEARVLSIALILLADDQGRGRFIPTIMGARIFPRNPGIFPGSFCELADMGFVRVYESVGQKYWEIRNWSKHQRVDKPAKPRVPEPLEDRFLKSQDFFLGIPGTSRLTPIPIPTSDQDPDPDHEIREGVHREFEQRPELSLTAPSAPVSRPKRKRDLSPGRQEQAKSIRAAYCDEYRKRYGKNPPWGAREWGQLYDLMGSWVPGELLTLVPKFFTWANRDVIRGGHQWGKGPHCFVLKAGELDADVQAPERRQLAAIVHDRQQQQDRAVTTDDQAARVAKLVREKLGNGQASRTLGTNHDASRSLQPPNQRPSAIAVGRETSGVHRAGTGSGSQRGDDPADHADPWGSDSGDAGSSAQGESAETEGA